MRFKTRRESANFLGLLLKTNLFCLLFFAVLFAWGQVRSVVRFLDKDSSGTIDVAEIDEAVREFRELTLGMPSLGTGPMTVIDAVEIGRLARRTFADIVANNASLSPSSRIDNDNNACSGGSNDGDDDDNGEHQDTVRVSDVSAAFEEAFRQFKADGEGQHSIAAMRHPGIQQPSTDTQHAQVRLAVIEAGREGVRALLYLVSRFPCGAGCCWLLVIFAPPF